MPTSDARVQANRQNSSLSTGPKTPEGKDRSRQNALKHGLTGAGVVLPVEDAAEVERRFVAFRRELQPSSELAVTLVRRAATLAVRMEKCSELEMAATAERMAQAAADFEAPEGANPAEVARLRTEAARAAAFDPSKEACLLRRYEASAERGFYRALKELRLAEKASQTVAPELQAEVSGRELGSFLDRENLDDERDFLSTEVPLPAPRKPVVSPVPGVQGGSNGCFDVPFTIGRSR
jgi:hypothetical protein